MKKIFPLCLAAFFCAAAPRAVCKTDRADAANEVQSCEAILQEFVSDPAPVIPRAVLQNAHALIILNQFKAGFLFGVKGGYGVVMVKRPGGHWSVPVLVDADEASLGLQLGAKSVESVYVINDDVTPRRLFKARFNIGVDAKAVAGPNAAEAEKNYHPALAAPVLFYTKSTGLFAGATVKAGVIGHDDQANFALYNTDHTLPELLYSDWVTPPPEVQPLMQLVGRLAP